jgi:hypothetical protein
MQKSRRKLSQLHTARYPRPMSIIHEVAGRTTKACRQGARKMFTCMACFLLPAAGETLHLDDESKAEGRVVAHDLAKLHSRTTGVSISVKVNVENGTPIRAMPYMALKQRAFTSDTHIVIGHHQGGLLARPRKELHDAHISRTAGISLSSLHIVCCSIHSI